MVYIHNLKMSLRWIFKSLLSLLSCSMKVSTKSLDTVRLIFFFSIGMTIQRRVRVRYWNSCFLGHTTHLDLLQAFEDGLAGVDLIKMIQVSMNGPNTNLKFLEVLKKKREREKLKDIIDIGSCNLHTVHGAFQTGAKASGWQLNKVLKGSYTLLHDTPARRDDYFNITSNGWRIKLLLKD